MKKILITGAQGFIGKNLQERLCEKYTVLAPFKEDLDLCDGESVADYFSVHDIDIVIHAANYGARDAVTVESFPVISNGLRMFYNLAKFSDYYEKMLYFGSGAEFGREKWKSGMKEEDLGSYIPTDAYGLYKYVITKQLSSYNNIYNLRLFGICGRYEEYRRFLSSNVIRALKGIPLTLSQNQKFDYIHVKDLIPIVEWFIENDPKYKDYNICRGEEVELLKLAEMVRGKLSPQNEIIVAKSGWKNAYSGNNSRLTSEVGNIKFIDYDKMIDDLAEYYSDKANSIDEELLP